jgi:hypothetical protein
MESDKKSPVALPFDDFLTATDVGFPAHDDDFNVFVSKVAVFFNNAFYHVFCIRYIKTVRSRDQTFSDL